MTELQKLKILASEAYDRLERMSDILADEEFADLPNYDAEWARRKIGDALIFLGTLQYWLGRKIKKGDG